MYDRQPFHLLFPEVFEALNRIREPLSDWLEDNFMPVSGTAAGVVKVGIVFRAANLHASVVALLRAGAEQDALILTRSLFELLVNTEELLRSPDDLEQKSKRFLNFVRLQQYLSSREMYLSHLFINGQAAPPILAVAQHDEQAEQDFAEFRYRDKKQRLRWRSSWCGKPVAVLASQSSSRMREIQYRIIYKAGSEMVHAGPSAVFPALYPHSETPTEARVEAYFLETREENLRLAAAFSSTFMAEIFLRLFDAIPGFDPSWGGKLVPGFVVQILRGAT
jgi:hypothetical protein